MQTATWHRQVDRGRNFVSFQQTSFHLPHLSLLLDGRHAQDARTAGEIKPHVWDAPPAFSPFGGSLLRRAIMSSPPRGAGGPEFENSRAKTERWELRRRALGL